ncbi:hypothetical protein AEA42_09890 [Shewanella sp. Sh95]|uniref:hypothetical protein n=1 Tax=Shewanella sp. Sh95 TaxID=1689868 RepID=UPI0006D9B94B|nr:hypothetical protein [Shewanella sp. Sh95]KPN77125.1 hypothetical protein AEA42_09890 [Shewanella sp. Sh95]
MFKKLTLSMQISGGYALVLLLLIVISLAAYVGLTKAIDGFNDYRSLARDSEESPDDLQINHQIRVEAHLVA